MKLIKKISGTIQAWKNCIVSKNIEWANAHRVSLNEIDDMLPSGSGIDSGSYIDRESSTANRVVIDTAYHHMDEYGGYDGWTEHRIIVTPLFYGIDIQVTGENRNGIKEYLGDLFYDTLTSEWSD
jgi:hypothetical protein